MALELARRNLVWGGAKLGGGALLALGSLAALLDPAPSLRGDIAGHVCLSAMAVAGIALALSNIWLLIRRPIVLRATDEGIWFGAGPVIPWRDVAYVYESGMNWKYKWYSGRSFSVSFSLHRARTVFKLPPFLWWTSTSLSDVRISAVDAEAQPHVLVALLECMRKNAPAASP